MSKCDQDRRTLEFSLARHPLAMCGMTVKTTIKAMAGGDYMQTTYSNGKPHFWLDDRKGRCVRLPYAVGKEVSESPLIEPCDPGLFDGFPQSYRIRGAKP